MYYTQKKGKTFLMALQSIKKSDCYEQVIGLKRSEALPTEKRWRMTEVHTFTLNKTKG
jgi:hypothetical protein